MAVTGQDVINRLNNIFRDSGDGKWSPTQKLEFVNAAIDAAWGMGVKDKKIDSSITLDSGVFEYTPSAAPELEDGFAAAYVTPLSATQEPKIRLRRIWQRLNGTTWTIVAPNETTTRYDGKTLHLHYNSRIARISAATGNIELPFDYLWKYAAWVAATSGVAGGANFNAKPFEALLPVWSQEATRAAASVQRGFITKLPVLYESGRAAHTDPNAGVYRV